MGNVNTYGPVSSDVLAVLRGRGVRTPFGTINFPTSRSLYVRSTGPADGDPKEIVNGGDFYTTVAAALDHCRSGKGDQVIVLDGHTETVSTADAWPNLKPGTKIIGWGDGTNRPTVTFSAAAASILLNVANVSISNFIFNCAGNPSATTALTVAAPFTVSDAGCGFYGCDFQVGVDADQIVTKAITTTDAANRFSITDSHFYGATAAECTTVLEVLGSDDLRLENVHIQAATSSTTVGVMRLNATALLGGFVSQCSFINRKASSVHAVTGVASSAGVCQDTNFGILDNATLAGWVTKGDWMFFRCQTVNFTGETGAATTVVSV
jgi:hypothetical protein